MATRAQFENSNEIGVFSKLTNSFALCAIGGSENFYSVFEAELADHIPVVHASIAGCRFLGRVCVGTEACIRDTPCACQDLRLSHSSMTRCLPQGNDLALESSRSFARHALSIFICLYPTSLSYLETGQMAKDYEWEHPFHHSLSRELTIDCSMASGGSHMSHSRR